MILLISRTNKKEQNPITEDLKDVSVETDTQKSSCKRWYYNN